MSAWLDPVRRALTAEGSSATLFFRDDDAGWEDERLYRLLDVTTAFGVPVALAAIPAAIGVGLAASLRALLAARNETLSVHQHGFTHVNHEPSGRRCEFGVSRLRDQQRSDLIGGRQRLEDALGCALPPIFTPPWNRCTRDTAECLVELGFGVLSRDISAEPFGLAPLYELPVCLDWSGPRGARMGATHWGESIARAIASRKTVGLMLHHAMMTADDRHMLRELLHLVTERPNVAVQRMGDLSHGARFRR